jgi:HEAT repeat protein
VSLRLGLERFRLAGGIPSADYLRAVVRSWFDSGAPDRELELALEHDNAFVQELAAELLGQRGRAARGSLAALHHALTRPRPFLEPGVAVRGPDWAATVVGDFAPRVDAAIAAAMVAIAPHADATIDAWIVRLGDLRPSFREEAAVELGRYGADAARAVPALREALDDTHLAVVREAVTSLGVIGPDAHEALPALELLAGDPDREIAVRARAASRRVRGR